ncbi:MULTISPECIES: DUF2759 domain-containing protein [Halalkalibacter]|jgi:hypothetical protein|uniref:DUF2759 domain-containing protein n=1 Tax=Halalkalibacter alkaliphilus TaxID=2917993 RepID=A0A9X2I8Q8_9BACI|nr:DUF2759 domain-containing protein [Halalkalibacter alkaliphilus]MCL7749858.1 DUF2759 domain-containing protein [Halalkalibacter alkaliphilus]
MIFSIIMLVTALLCAVAIVRELRRKNFFAVGFAGISFVVFGWFAVATIISIITTGGGAPTAH